MEKKKMHQDVYIGIVCMILTAVVFIMNKDIPTDAAIMPRLLGTMMGILSVLMVYQGLKKSKTEDEIKPYLNGDIMKVPFITWLIVGGYVLLFKLVGYFVATPVMLLLLMRYMKQTSWKTILAIAAVYLLIIYFFFVKQMGISIGNLGMLGKMI